MRTRRRGAAGRRAAAWLATAACVAAAACSDSHLVTGAYRSDGPVAVEGVPGLDAAYVELVVGQFGPDVAGLIRFYQDPTFIQPIDGVCRCRFLTDGRFDDQTLVFAFPDPEPCQAEATDLVVARLTASKDGDTLTGSVGKNLSAAQPATFLRTTQPADLGTQDKTCDETGAAAVTDDGAADPGGTDVEDAAGGADGADAADGGGDDADESGDGG